MKSKRLKREEEGRLRKGGPQVGDKKSEVLAS